MPSIIAIANQKGGVGKTTVTVNLGAALAETGRRMLLVDLDPQGSLTLSLGLRPDVQEQTIYDALTAAADGKPVLLRRLIRQVGPLSLIPSNIGLSAADVELSGPLGAFALRDALEGVPPEYDLVLIDCPPNLGVLTLSALLAASYVVVPLQADYLATRGLALLTEQVRKVQRRANPSLKLLGIVVTMVDTRTRHTRDVLAAIREMEQAKHLPVFATTIPLTVRLKDASAEGKSVLDIAGDSAAAQVFRDLAGEVVEAMG